MDGVQAMDLAPRRSQTDADLGIMEGERHSAGYCLAYARFRLSREAIANGDRVLELERSLDAELRVPELDHVSEL
jgi:hypothetical protein